MKKIIKSLSFILLMLVIFAVATPQTVNASYCAQPNVMKFGNAYETGRTSRLLPESYGNADESLKQEYMRDYVLSASNYTEQEKQQAIHLIEGDKEGWYSDSVDSAKVNKLYNEALAYANSLLSQNVEKIKVTKDEDARTSFVGSNLVYGPIYVVYPDGEIETRREWGGFYYEFADEDGNDLTDKVKLCTYENGQYKEIENEKNKDGSRKVTSADYSGKNLYIVTSEKLITKVYLKAYSFQTIRKAEVVTIYYSATVSEETVWLCGKQTTEVYYLWEMERGNDCVAVQTYPGFSTTHSWSGSPTAGFECSGCGATASLPMQGVCKTYPSTTYYQNRYEKTTTCTGCGKKMTSDKGHTYSCGQTLKTGSYASQAQEEIYERGEEEEIISKDELEIELGATVEVTKTWDDYDNDYDLRPDRLYFNVFRSTDKENWEKLTEDKDYKVATESKEGNTWKVLIVGLLRINEQGQEYYFKVEEQEQLYFNPTYPEGNYPSFKDNPAYGYLNISNSLKHIAISGYVWLDGQTGIKPAVPNNGIMDETETKMEGITVYLYYKNPTTGETSKVATTQTDKNGYYEFKDKEIGNYYVEFEYDGINYKDTIKVEGGSSSAFENGTNRKTFNSRFQTITYGKSNDGTTLKYNYENGKSTLITTDGNKVKAEFIMNATTDLVLYSKDTGNINLGLVKRGTDIALSTDVADAEVNINGQKTTYTYNKADNTIEITNGQTSEKVSYNLNLYASDYNYRIRDYVSNSEFQENDYINEGETAGIKTGDELKVYVKYAVNIQNQSEGTIKVNEAKYVYDEKYTYKGMLEANYGTTVEGNTITINFNGLELKEGETKTIYLLFEVNNNNGLKLGNFTNKAEITSYSTEEGLIDTDSQPGNFINDKQVEDDNDTAGGLTIKVEDTLVRKITGKVFDEDGKNVNDVIVQLIEVKTVNGKVYEYIWEETVSGTGKGKKLTADGTKLEEYTYTQTEGYYEFKGMIPGDYIVRFIYGDGTTYDMTENVIKYNGQDYKSVKDANYNAEWYNSSTYTSGASVARDNEARRLETMAYSVEIDAEKGVLLKLLDNVELNTTEKETIITVYKKLYGKDISNVTEDVINKLLKEQVLKNTWMCAETSKIKISVDTDNSANVGTETTVNGINRTGSIEIANVNLGLEVRPVTKIELKKYITGFKLVASNGQTLVNAYIDVNEYLDDSKDISSKVQGIKDNVTILDTVWQYEVAPTDVNTIVDGASLEMEYTLVVRNTGEEDYLSQELANAYANSKTEGYTKLLQEKASEMKNYMKVGTYRTKIGKNLGTSYYAGGTGKGKVLTEVTDIRDYINNDLTFVFSYEGKVEEDADAPKTHRILRDDYSMQETTLSTILKTTEATGKLDTTGNAVMYKITLGKNPISSTGNLVFDTYIAEVMSYTNAAGRRSMTSTPGNAEIIDAERREGKTHEIDEADTGRIQVGAATGEDEKTNYIIVIAVAGALVVMAVGAYIVKKYVIK